jgi:hypothetical protein
MLKNEYLLLDTYLEPTDDDVVDNFYYTLEAAEQPKREVVCIARIQTWKGYFWGYPKAKPYEPREFTNFTDMAKKCMLYDEQKVFVDTKGDFIIEDTHHDGINVYRFRMWKAATTRKQKNEFYDALYNQTITEDMIQKYTMPIGKNLLKG